MNITKIRRESVNTMTLEIDGIPFRIHGEEEITKRDESSIRNAVETADTMEEVAENLSFYDRTIKSAQ